MSKTCKMSIITVKDGIAVWNRHKNVAGLNQEPNYCYQNVLTPILNNPK